MGFDLIIANLPYLDPKWFNDKSIKFEPAVALGAGELGIDLYRRFFRQVKKYHPKTTILIEIDPRQKKAIESLLLDCNYRYAKGTNNKDRFMEISCVD